MVRWQRLRRCLAVGPRGSELVPQRIVRGFRVGGRGERVGGGVEVSCDVVKHAEDLSAREFATKQT